MNIVTMATKWGKRAKITELNATSHSFLFWCACLLTPGESNPLKVLGSPVLWGVLAVEGAVRSSFPTQHCLFCCSSTAALDCLRPRSPQTVSSLLSFQSFIPSISLCSWHIVKTQSMVSKWADRCVNSRVTNCPPWTKSEGFLGCGAFIVKIRAVGTLSEWCSLSVAELLVHYHCTGCYVTKIRQWLPCLPICLRMTLDA